MKSLHFNLISFVLFICQIPLFAGSSIDKNNDPIANIYYLALAIDDYKNLNLKNCVSDAEHLSTLFMRNAEVADSLKSSIQNDTGLPVHVSENADSTKIIHFKLYDEYATAMNVNLALAYIRETAKPNDYFVFYYAGFSFKHDANATHLYLFQEKPIDFTNATNNSTISIPALAKQMDGIECLRQLIISEAGSGNDFASDLIINLFEQNPFIAEGIERNRIILTTNGLGYDEVYCEDGRKDMAPLMYFISQSKSSLLSIFERPEKFQFGLDRAEILCAWREWKYAAIYREKQYKGILIDALQERGKRGGAVIDEVEEIPVLEYQKHAVLIATDNYEASTWGDLRNPIKDANAVGELLADRYNMQIHKYYNTPVDSIYMALNEIKNALDSTGQLLVFIAGHGYYDKVQYPDGAIVCSNSNNIADDFRLNSYLKMSDLKLLLNSTKAKNVLVIFDVCFGATFELNKPLALNDYDFELKDISLAELINRKSKYPSRIFLASGRYEVDDYWFGGDHSPFAYKLIKLLDEEKGFISPGKIKVATDGNTSEPILGSFGTHHPSGDFLLKKNE